jgi:hypothetical protein
MSPTPSTRQVRKVVVRLTIGSFSVAALLGIAALLAGGRFGETEARILLTTLLVGVVSIAVLCYLATAGKRFQVVGVAGGVTVLVPLATALLMIWGPGLADEPAVFKTFGVGAIVAASLAQASLLLALCERGRRLIRRLLVATLVFAGLVAAMTAVLVLADGDNFPDWYFRLLGVIAILDVLGTVTVAALMKFGPSETEAATLTLPPSLSTRLAEAAASEGRSPSDLATEAIERYLGGAG